MFGEQNARITIAFGRAIAFILGASFSLIVGQLGMRMAVQGNIRVAAASMRDFGDALRIAYRSGTVTGMLTDGLGLLGGTIIFIIFGAAAPDALLGFGFGGTLVALFMRVGGGIYTKAADVGADLVGKVEEDLEEDDPRNAAVIADQVGDNVGDCAGMAADIFESYEVTIVSALILGLALMALTGQIYWIVFPLLVRAIGVISSIVGTFSVPVWERTVAKGNAWHAMEIAYEVSSVITITLSFVLAFVYIKSVEPVNWWQPAAMVSMGVIFNVIVNRLTAYFTATDKSPVQEIAKSTRFGPATTILSGLAEGYESSTWSVLTIAAAIMISVLIYGDLGAAVRHLRRGADRYRLADPRGQPGLHGLLRPHLRQRERHRRNGQDARERPQDHDRPGRGRQHDQGHHQGCRHRLRRHRGRGAVRLVHHRHRHRAAGAAGRPARSPKTPWSPVINIADPRGLRRLPDRRRHSHPLRRPAREGGLPRGQRHGCRRAQGVRRAGRPRRHGPARLPQAVGISTVAAQRELLPVGIIVVLIPIVVGFTLKAEALGGFLAGVILSGQLLAVFMSNAGGAWDNAKKLVEEGHYGGKGSEAHKASIVGDTVGDPLKDTAGPALNPLIKVINLISLIIAPIVVASNTLDLGTADRHGRPAGDRRLGDQPQQAAGAVRGRRVTSQP